MIGRALESHGIATVQICLIREHAERVKPARALVVRFPYGLPLGRPDDPAFQHRVLRAAFDLLGRPSGPALEEFPEEIAGSGMAAPGRPAPPVDRSDDVAFEVTTLRPYYRQQVERQGGRTLVGLTGVLADRLRGLVRFLEAYARGDAELPVWPAERFGLEQYVRLASDDLKAFYVEARLGQSASGGTPSGEAVQDWLWTETALAGLLRRCRDRMREAGGPAVEQLAIGIVRWERR